MDKTAKKKYCHVMMFDVPPPSFTKNNSKSDSSNQLTVDYTTSLENSSIRTQDNFIFTSFLEPINVRPQLPHKNTQITRLEQDKDAIKEPICQEKKIRRPPNSFILYRQAMQQEVTRLYGNISNSMLSKILSDLWQNESEEVKLYWNKVADKKRMEHMQAYPDYCYRPKKLGNKSKKSRKLESIDSKKLQYILPTTQTSYTDISFPLISEKIDPTSFYNQFDNSNSQVPPLPF
ncbi:8551_t:CDS:2 [Scutellospora calospora]|uniref:8551_t:CDS:1 n=1 Tax=Scutellospora calospora TaxID=85575 RepID=A0ACA9K8X2_9GLOM|nr:8551_t:CDS:2 [Scutellospora calospora]